MYCLTRAMKLLLLFLVVQLGVAAFNSPGSPEVQIQPSTSEVPSTDNMALNSSEVSISPNSPMMPTENSSTPTPASSATEASDSPTSTADVTDTPASITDPTTSTTSPNPTKSKLDPDNVTSSTVDQTTPVTVANNTSTEATEANNTSTEATEANNTSTEATEANNTSTEATEANSMSTETTEANNTSAETTVTTTTSTLTTTRQVIDCGVPDDILNGNFSLSDNQTTENSTVTYRCYPGYSIEQSDAMVVCLSTGNWSQLPNCQPKDCGALTDPGNGHVNVTNTTFNSLASYTCHTGYTLTGSDVVKCNSSGIWNDTAPTCTVVDCEGPATPANGSVEVDTITYGSMATFKCNTGYELDGVQVATCGADGDWNASAPSCTIMDCGQPDQSQDGSVNVTMTTYNSLATYTCDIGHHLVAGSDTVKCNASGQWNDTAPMCALVHCPIPRITPYQGLRVDVPESTPFRSNVTYSCDEGYELNGAQFVTCQADGRWNATMPTCDVIGIGYNESCLVGLHPNPCTTVNATCRNDVQRCLCLTDDYYYNGTSCAPKLNVNITSLSFRIGTHIGTTFIQIRWNDNTAVYPNRTFNKIDLTITSNTVGNTTGYHRKIPIPRNLDVVDKMIIGLLPGKLYNISCSVSRNGVPNRMTIPLSSYTRPLPPSNWTVSHVDSNGFTLSWDEQAPVNSPFTEYSVRLPDGAYVFSGRNDSDVNASGWSNDSDVSETGRSNDSDVSVSSWSNDVNVYAAVCDQVPVPAFADACTFGRKANITSMTVGGLAAGTQYTVAIYTVIGGLRSTDALNVTLYTAPVLPTNISIPDASIATDGFNVSYTVDGSNIPFTEWSVTVYGTSAINGSISMDDVVAEMRLDADSNQATLRNDSIVSGSLYIVEVMTFVPGLSSDPKEIQVITRPSPPMSLDVPTKNSIHENNFTVTIVFADIRFDGYVIQTCPKDDHDVTTADACVTEVHDVEDQMTPSNLTRSHVISGLKAATLYSVSVWTDMTSGIQSDAAELDQSTGPVPPRVTLGDIGNNSVTILVTDIAHLKFDSFFVVIRNAPDGHDNGYTKKLNDTDMGLVKDGLIAGTFYTFHIYTILGSVTSDRFATASSYTKPGAVAADTIHVTATTESTIAVTWDPPVHGVVNETVVVFDCISPNTDSTMNTSQAIVVPGNMKYAEAGRLDPGTSCTVAITTVIYNHGDVKLNGQTVSKQLGRTSDETAPNGVSQPQVASTTNVSGIVTWSKPSKQNGVIKRYDVIIYDTSGLCVKLYQLLRNGVSIQPSDGKSQCPVHRVENAFTLRQSDLQQNITGLRPYRNYTVEIVAYTVARGDITTLILSTTEGVPGNRIAFSQVDTSHNTIELYWNAPEEHNGIVDGYVLTYIYHEHLCGGAAGQLTSRTVDVNTDPLTSYTLGPGGDIYASWTYNITVAAINSMGTGLPSPVRTVTTKDFRPDIVENIQANCTTPYTVNVTWHAPCFSNGQLRGYNVTLVKDSDRQHGRTDWLEVYPFNADVKEASLPVLPYRNYTITIQAINDDDISDPANVTNVQAPIASPQKPVGVVLSKITSSSLQAVWSRPDMSTGPTYFRVDVVDLKNTTVKIAPCVTPTHYWLGDLARSCVVKGLDAFWEYDVSVTAVTSDGELTYNATSESFQQTTLEAKPEKLKIVEVTAEQDVTKPRKIFVSWKHLSEREQNGNIINYKVTYNKTEIVLPPETTSKDILVTSAGPFVIQVSACTKIDCGQATDNTIIVPPGAPMLDIDAESAPLVHSADEMVADDTTQVAVTIPLQLLCNTDSGTLTRRGIIVAEASQADQNERFVGSASNYSRKIEDGYKSWFDVHDADTIVPYITTSADWHPDCTGTLHQGSRTKRAAEPLSMTFVVGDAGECAGVDSNQYCNGQLQPDKQYRVKTFACTHGGCTETKYSDPISTAPDYTVAIGAGVGSGVVVILLVIVAIVIMKRRQTGLFAKDHERGNTHVSRDVLVTEMTEHKGFGFRPGPVLLADFPAHVEKMHNDSDLLFSDAYKMLKENSPQHAMHVAESQICRPRNRYTNILPYDHSRVKLRPLDDVEGSDFINANYIPGYTSRREYIATQGPMQATFDDFWRMIWEQNVDTIVMLTKLVEKGRLKCDKYWPELQEPVFYGDLVVSLQSESNLSDYTLRIFEIKVEQETRTLRHFSYLKWPDMGCPDDPSMLLSFAKTVNQHRKPASRRGPIVVHCSAGVGRTGTYIAVDYLLQHIRDHDELDIYKLVLDMRNDRCNMVQTEDQYIYIHECLKSFITTDDEEDDESEEGIYQNTRTRDEENVYENTSFALQNA